MRLGRKFGTAEFLGLALEPALAPDGKALADKVLGATRRVLRDPMRLAGLVDRLKSPAAADRIAATAELSFSGDAAVNALLTVMADAGRAAEHANVRTALVDLGSHSVGPLTGALETADQGLKAQVIEVLYRLDAHDASIYLLAPSVEDKADPKVQATAQAVLKRWLGAAPTREQAVATLAKDARYYFGGGQVKPPDFEGNVRLWHWDAQAHQAVQRTYKAADASLALATRLSADWLALEPSNEEARRIYLTSLLQVAAYQNGLGKPLPAGDGTARDRAASLGAPAIEDVLIHSMEGGQFPAAAAAARLLGEIGKEDLLQAKSGKPAALVRAVSHPDARVRFAAVEAITKLSPTKPFASLHTVPQTLAFFASSTGSLKALVADSHAQEAQRMAGLLTELGYEGEIVTSARQMLRRAMASPDIALVLFNTSLPYADADLLLQELRHDSRTALVPVGFLSLGNDLKRLERLTKKYPRTAVFVRTQNVPDMQLQVNRLLEPVGRDFLTLEERQHHAKQSLVLLARLSGEGSFYDVKVHERLLEPAMFVPELSPHGSEVLANLGTPYAQRTLINVASTLTLPLEARQAAAAAFVRSVPQHGLQLTRDEIVRQYDRYNASRSADEATQDALASILDAMEALRKKPAEKNPGDQKPATQQPASGGR
jgi:CheY-like chemotaxis protein